MASTEHDALTNPGGMATNGGSVDQKKPADQVAVEKADEQPLPLIIHHLSDIKYQDSATEDGSARRQRDILVQYSGYLKSLPDDRWPEIVVITGDISASGAKQDLRAVANFFANSFPKWAGKLDQHIFVVPGASDVDWESPGDTGWKTFYDSFREFALPNYPNMPAGRGTPGSSTERFVGYAVGTCYTPKEFYDVVGRSRARRRSGNFNTFRRRYRRLHSPFRALLRRLSGPSARALRKQRREAGDQFVQLTEDAWAPGELAGRALAQDLSAFQTWATTFNSTKSSGGVQPLKALITRHPLALQTQGGALQQASPSLQQLAQYARDAKFHLILHGRMRDQQALTDVTVLEGSDPEQPLRQIGAASMGDQGVFNEIVAEYRKDGGKPKDSEKPKGGEATKGGVTAADGAKPTDGANSSEENKRVWRIELRLINVNTFAENTPAPFLLLNPEESADKIATRLQRVAATRKEFESRLRLAMRRFSEEAHRVPVDKQAERLNHSNHLLPQSAMQIVEQIIREVIFEGYASRIRILLMDKSDHRLLKLTAEYLAPPVQDGPDTLFYPASVAAWSLALGRTLIYPNITRERTSETDHEWLRTTEKIHGLEQALVALSQEAAARSSPDLDAMKRYESLKAALTKINNKTKDAAIEGTDIFQASPAEEASRTFPAFICVPFPTRPRGGALHTLPETMVLDVGIRPIASPNTQPRGAQPPTTQPLAEAAFTTERIEMLELLAEMIGMMLTSASALGRPRGVWDDRTRLSRD